MAYGAKEVACTPVPVGVMPTYLEVENGTICLKMQKWEGAKVLDRL